MDLMSAASPAGFGLAYDDEISAQVRAINAAGLPGEWGQSSVNGRVKTKPPKMDNVPTRGASTNELLLHVEWDTLDSMDQMGGSQVIYYTIYKEDDLVTPIYTTSGSSYLYPKEPLDTDGVRFAVAAANIYGTGEPSDLSDLILFGAVPDKLTGLESNNFNNNEQATIIWDDPGLVNNIDEYIFEVLDMNQNIYVDATTYFRDDSNGNNLGREVDCQDLIDFFGYHAGDKITFRVAASNQWGESEWAYPNVDDMNATTLALLI